MIGRCRCPECLAHYDDGGEDREPTGRDEPADIQPDDDAADREAERRNIPAECR